MFNKIAVICTGNICRSPIGEALLKARLNDSRRTILSAGIGALVGHPADNLAKEVALENGLDISNHRAQQASQQLLTSMDLILTMDQTHSDWINHKFPQLCGRVHKILKWHKDRDVADPYRLQRTAFETAFAEIDSGILEWLKRL